MNPGAESQTIQPPTEYYSYTGPNLLELLLEQSSVSMYLS